MGDCRRKSLVRSIVIVELAMFIFSIIITALIAIYCRNGLIDSQREYVEHIADLTLDDTQTEIELQKTREYIKKTEENWEIQWFPKSPISNNLGMKNYNDDEQGLLIKELNDFSVIIKYDIESINDETKKFTVVIFIMIFCVAEVAGIIMVVCIKKIVLNTMLRKMQCIQETAEKDRMTELYNKCRFFSRIYYYNNCRSIGVIYIDINDLKKANDTYGHNVGNELICAVANSMKDLEYDNIECYRFGGDEFIIVLPNYTETTIKQVKDTILSKIDKISFNSVPIKPSVACGIAFQNKSIDIEKLIKQADQAMYHCKRKQKN